MKIFVLYHGHNIIWYFQDTTGNIMPKGCFLASHIVDSFWSTETEATILSCDVLKDDYYLQDYITETCQAPVIPFNNILHLSLSLSPFLSLSLSYTPSPSLFLSLPPFLSLSPFLSDRWRGCAREKEREKEGGSERERERGREEEREKEGGREREKKGERVVGILNLQACPHSKRSPFGQSVSQDAWLY